MKKVIYTFILILASFSCSSDDDKLNRNADLIGKWILISSCGGFDRDCWYPENNNYESIQFTNEMYIKKNNGVINTELEYSIYDIQNNDSGVLYTLQFQNGNTLRYRFVDQKLSIEGGDFWKQYERVNKQ